MNPFFSLQYTKDDYGQKIIHPSINLHITPDEFLLTKLIGKKKAAKSVLLAHKLHSLTSYQPGPGPILFDQPGPIFHGPSFNGPSFHGPPPPYFDRPVYGPSFDHHPPPHSSFSPYNAAPVIDSFDSQPPFIRSAPGQPLNFSPESEYAPQYSHSSLPLVPSYRKSSSDVIFPDNNGNIWEINHLNLVLFVTQPLYCRENS